MQKGYYIFLSKKMTIYKYNQNIVTLSNTAIS